MLEEYLSIKHHTHLYLYMTYKMQLIQDFMREKTSEIVNIQPQKLIFNYINFSTL